MFEQYAKNEHQAFDILMGYFKAGQIVEYKGREYEYTSFITLLELLDIDEIIPVTAQLPKESRKLVRGYIISRCMGELDID